MDQIKQLKDYCDEISLDDLRFVKVRQKIEKMHEQNNITIIDFIKQKEYDLSVRAKNVLKYASHLYTYMNELSVIKLVKIRTVGLKSVKEIIHVYPNLENEVGHLTSITIREHLNKEVLAFVEFVCSSKNQIGYHEEMKKWYIYGKGLWVDSEQLFWYFNRNVE
jgi:hypothetical protein